MRNLGRFKGDTVVLQMATPIVVCQFTPSGPMPGMVPAREPTPEEVEKRIAPPMTLAQMPFLVGKVQEVDQKDDEDDGTICLRHPSPNGGEVMTTLLCKHVIAVSAVSSIAMAH